MATLEEARIAKEKAKVLFPTATGVGISKNEGGYLVKVLVKDALAQGTLSTSIDNVPVSIEVVGEITALEDSE